MAENCSLMANLPTETLYSEVLPRLPPKTLFQFKSFDKSLYDHISSKKFIDLHLKHTISSSNSDRRLIMVFTAVRNDRKKYLYFVDTDSPESPPRYLPLPPPFCDRKKYSTTVVGSCNGLLCVKASIAGCVKCCWIIVNPCTGKISITISMMSDTISEIRSCSGFGYDALIDDYKLVNVEHFYDRKTNMGCRNVKVYSMKTNSWKIIDTAFVSVFVPEFSSPPWRAKCVLINNNLMHWMLVRSTSDGPKRNVICFNLETEQWDADIRLPNFDGYYLRGADQLDFGVLNGCLCFSINNQHDKFVGWIMKEYGVKESWTKFSFHVPAQKGFHPIFPNWKGATQEILLEKKYYEGSSYVWYNIRDKTVKKLELSGAPKDLMIETLCLASLVTDFGDHQTKKRKPTDKELIKVDKKFKIVKLEQ